LKILDRRLHSKRAEVLMSNATVWMSVVVLSACSSDSTKHWTALLGSKEGEDMSITQYEDLDLADDHEAAVASRGLIEAEGVGFVEIETVPATWQPDGDTVAVHIDKTVIPMGGFMPELDFSCAAAQASLVCTFADGGSYTFEEREEEPVPDERWTLVEYTYGTETELYPTERPIKDGEYTWIDTLSVAFLRTGDDVTLSAMDTYTGSPDGGIHSTESLYYGTWTGGEHPQLYFPAEKMPFDCESDGDEMTCESWDTVYVFQRE